MTDKLEPRINTMYITMQNQPTPILVFNTTNTDFNIDVHIQCIYFSLTPHNFVISAKDQLGNEYLEQKVITIDFSDTGDFINDQYGIAEAVFYIKMSPEEAAGVNSLSVSVKIDSEYEQTTVLFVARGDLNG